MPKRTNYLILTIVILVLAVLALPFVNGRKACPDDTVKVQTASIEENEMKYAVFGSGEKNFVILPGLSFKPVTDSAQAVADAYKSFGEEYTVWLFDIRSNLPKHYSIREAAADTAAVMRSLGIEKADFFGASLGGMITQYIAIDHPEIVNKIVLGSSMCRNNDVSAETIKTWHTYAEEGKLENLVAVSIDGIYSENTLQNYRDVLIQANSDLTEEDIERYLIMTESIAAFDCAEELQTVTCPILV